jgi:Sporulation and spore germination
MNPALKRTAGLTLLILVIAAAVWVIVYFGNQNKNTVTKQPHDKIIEDTINSEVTDVPTSTLNTIELDLKAGDFLPNPFPLPATTTFFNDRYWVLVDTGDVVIASGTFPGLISSYSAFGDVYWYKQLPASKTGELQILASDEGPQIIIPIKLQTKTQTVEIYFRNAALSNCGSVDSVKRTIVSTGDNDLNFYEAAINELLKGPNKKEKAQGLVTMIPEQVEVLRVGKNEKGRYVADFTSDLKDPNQIDCFWSITKNQIQKTLSTVPLPGKTLEGIILIEGETAE